MEIRIFGMTVRLEILVITLIVGMIMGGHMLCACSKVPLSEAFATTELMTGKTGESGESGDTAHDAAGESVSETRSTNTPAPANVPASTAQKNGNSKINAEAVAGLANLIPQTLNGFQNIISGMGTTPQSSTNDAAEPFTDYAYYKGGENNSDVSSSWINKASSYSKNLGYQQTAQKSDMYMGTQVPLPDGELFFFQNNQFKPECCPSPYSASTGCACMSSEQIAYLNSRGGNRSGDSEF
jgi:hypothetical protein